MCVYICVYIEAPISKRKKYIDMRHAINRKFNNTEVDRLIKEKSIP